MFFNVVLCQLSLMKQLFPEKFFSRTCTIRAKNDVQLTFDDPYISYLSKIDVFQRSFVLILTNGTIFPQKIFSWTCILRKKNDLHLTLMTHIYNI